MPILRMLSNEINLRLRNMVVFTNYQYDHGLVSPGPYLKGLMFDTE